MVQEPREGLGRPSPRQPPRGCDEDVCGNSEAFVNKLVRIALAGVLALGITAVSAAPAAAQDGQQLGIGYQFINFSEFDLSYPLGINVDYEYPLTNLPLGIVAEFGWSRHSDDDFDFTSNLINFGVGGRWSFAMESPVTPYAQVLFGLQRDSDKFEDVTEFEGTNFMWQFGGGAAFPLNDMWDLFGQIDFRQVSYDSGAEWGVPRIFIGGRVGF